MCAGVCHKPPLGLRCGHKVFDGLLQRSDSGEQLFRRLGLATGGQQTAQRGSGWHRASLAKEKAWPLAELGSTAARPGRSYAAGVTRSATARLGWPLAGTVARERACA
jgi:hypothetical protein